MVTFYFSNKYVFTLGQYWLLMVYLLPKCLFKNAKKDLPIS
jgi:hypothetical protein